MSSMRCIHHAARSFTFPPATARLATMPLLEVNSATQRRGLQAVNVLGRAEFHCLINFRAVAEPGRR